MCSSCSDVREENSHGVPECPQCFHKLHGGVCTAERVREIDGSSETESGPCGCEG